MEKWVGLISIWGQRSDRLIHMVRAGSKYCYNYMYIDSSDLMQPHMNDSETVKPTLIRYIQVMFSMFYLYLMECLSKSVP